MFVFLILKILPYPALAKWLCWLDHCPMHQKVVGSISSQGTYLGFVFDSQSRHVWEVTDVSLLLSLSLSLSLSFSRPLPPFLLKPKKAGFMWPITYQTQ